MAKYKIVGPRSVAGIAPGGVVEFDVEEAAWLVEAGHLAPFATKTKAKALKAEAVDIPSDTDPNEGGEK
jgi:hypothetical protein